MSLPDPVKDRGARLGTIPLQEVPTTQRQPAKTHHKLTPYQRGLFGERQTCQSLKAWLISFKGKGMKDIGGEKLHSPKLPHRFYNL